MATVNSGSAPNLNDTDMFPVWDDDGQTDVQSLFKNPYFAPPDHRTDVAKSWYEKMKDIAQLFLYDMPGQANNVYDSGNQIYDNIISGSMPLPVQYFNGSFPPEACEKFRLWYNQGGRLKKSDPNPGPNKPNPEIPPPATRDFRALENPVWDAQGTEDDIKMCFTNPCWIPHGTLAAARWRKEMKNFQYDASVDPSEYMDLQKYEHVKGWARNIYTHVASQSMPISAPYFTDNACEAIRLWYNQGCAQDKSQVGHTTLPKDLILPDPVEKPFRMRKDINTLTEAELMTYRMQVLKLRPGKLDDSTWQVGGFLHANWCLHYMEASFPWHRAHLLWLETQIGGPIPYWNFFSSKASDPTSPDSGIPQAFLDDTFNGPDGKVYPNPLRHALARNGVSRVSTDKAPVKEVQRAQPFEQPEGPIKRAEYITQYVPTYLDQLYAATQMTKLGDPQGDGYPFTWMTTADPQNLNDLTVDNDKAFYASVQDQFDGVLEQAHDNFHGWAGPDMANNSYAAFDPLFWSFHANFDRIFEGWIRKNGQIEWSSNFPLRPFIGREGTITVSEGDKYTYRYTTIGNMVINSKALGYTFAPPGNPDYKPPPHKISMAIAPMILFPNVKCTDKTYIVHVALNPNKDDKPLVVGAPGYVGSITRLGMGPDNGNDRCIKGFVVRRLEATKAMNDVGGLTPNTEVPLKLQVLEDNRGVRREVPESEYKDWPGFRPLVIWGKPVAGVAAH